MLKRISNLIRFNWIVLVLIYLIVIAGSFVRITGSGMGCPDWPKCFGQWVPPTEESQLPENYREAFLEKRVAKIEKFAKLLTSVGLGETADKLLQDETLLQEEPFNARRTWTEYVNRLFGFLAGNGMLLAFLWLVVFFRKRKWILLSVLNLVLMAFQAWFGSIVVASNLIPWTITVHMFLALVIIALQLLLIHWMRKEKTNLSSEPNSQKELEKGVHFSGLMKSLLIICGLITTYQMFLGTQVREAIDVLTKMGFGREEWSDQLGMPFYIHRSFSWLVVVLMTFLMWKNEQSVKNTTVRWLYGILVIELISGVVLAHFNVPGLVQTAHLLFATVLFGLFTWVLFNLQSVTRVTS